jgi:hypothetical protein
MPVMLPMWLVYRKVHFPFTVKRTAFTNKAFSFTKLTTDVKIIGLSKNAFGLKENQGDAAVEDFSKPFFRRFHG